MKRILSSILTLVLFLSLLGGCATKSNGKDTPKGSDGNIDDGITEVYDSDCAKVLDTITYATTSTTLISVEVKGGVERTYSVLTVNDNGSYTVVIDDGKKETFKTQGGYLGVKGYINEAYDNGNFDGFAKNLIFADMRDLFKLSDSNVRYVSIFTGSDNVTTYTVDIFEGKVKDALPILQKEFESLEDVSYLKLILEKLGSKSTVDLQIDALYKNSDGVSQITVKVSHEKTVKVIE